MWTESGCAPPFLLGRDARVAGQVSHEPVAEGEHVARGVANVACNARLRHGLAELAADEVGVDAIAELRAALTRWQVKLRAVACVVVSLLAWPSRRLQRHVGGVANRQPGGIEPGIFEQYPEAP